MLNKKLFRDIKFNKSQFITIFLMVFIGVLAYSGIESYMGGMTKTANNFYGEYNLQDLDATGKNFTKEDLENIKKIEHVKGAERKLTVVGSMEHEEDRTLQLNFIESNEISKFYIVDGEDFDVSKSGVWLDEYYANNNNLKVGDTIKIKYDTATIEEKIIALINVPDHVYDIKDASAIFPNHLDYGFAYLSINEFPESYVKKLAMTEIGVTDEVTFDTLVPDFNYKDNLVFNYVMVDVDDENNKNFVKNKIDDEIKNSLGVLDIKDEASYSSYQSEIEEGETYVGVFSGLFLFIAVLSVITTMTRVVKKQRIQIGTLKALGFKKKTINAHYVGYGFWVSLIASALGVFAGPLLIGNLFLSMEFEFYQIPNGVVPIPASGFVVAIGVVIVVSIITYLTCRKELKENPAETLRTKLTKVNSRTLNITTKGFFKKMKFASKWNFRDIIRNKMRTIMGIAGITGCAMLFVCAFGMLDSLNNFLDIQFKKMYNFKYQLTINSDISDEKLVDILNKYGNNTSQTLLIEVKDGDNKVSNNIFVNDSSGYVKLLGHKWENVEMSDEGVYVTEKFAEVNGYSIGDTVTWHIFGDDTYYETKIIGLNRDPQNQNINMTKEYLESLGIKYKPDTIYTNDDLSNIKEIDGIDLIQDKDALEEGLNNMLNTMKSMIVLLIFIACLLGSVIIYNLGILSFTEKQYQFATLKVLGFKDKKIKGIYVKQNNWITYISILLGLPLGYLMTDFIFKMALSDSYDFGAYIKVITYVIGAIGTYAVSFIVSKLLAKKINKIDMVTSLKGNE